jgi:threonine aldolase
MRAAMASAEVGDDVAGEDPTVNRLQAVAAERFAKESALFFPTGTMANQAAVMALCRSGDQVIVHRQSHIYNLEVNGLATLCGVQARAIETPDGLLRPADLKAEICAASLQEAPTTLLCLENSFDLNRGLAVPVDHINLVTSLAHGAGLKVFMDGARLFNAAVALEISVDTLTESVDAVAVCLSKGLACPVGSLLMGPTDFIARAKRMRQRLGGGWRQAGILASAGLVALEEMVDRLTEDHANAQRLAEGLLALGFSIDRDQVQTNIVRVPLGNAAPDAA